jgi:hypothetical protein
MSCDLENVYLNVLCHEKIWFEWGLECSKDKGEVLIVVRALYGLKSTWDILEIVIGGGTCQVFN